MNGCDCAMAEIGRTETGRTERAAASSARRRGLCAVMNESQVNG